MMAGITSVSSPVRADSGGETRAWFQTPLGDRRSEGVDINKCEGWGRDGGMPWMGEMPMPARQGGRPTQPSDTQGEEHPSTVPSLPSQCLPGW
jgi:hypothetical protein